VKRLLLVLVRVGCSSDDSATGERTSTPPSEAPPAWLAVIGEYASGSDTVSILEVAVVGLGAGRGLTWR
jgi:hypothetical protein